MSGDDLGDVPVAVRHWRDRAPCVGLTDHFFPDESDNPAYALAVCRTCPVAEPCLDYAVSLPENPYGIWGGTTRQQRARIRRGNPEVVINHGTTGGYRAHLRRGEDACFACLAAHALHGQRSRLWSARAFTDGAA